MKAPTGTSRPKKIQRVDKRIEKKPESKPSLEKKPSKEAVPEKRVGSRRGTRTVQAKKPKVVETMDEMDEVKTPTTTTKKELEGKERQKAILEQARKRELENKKRIAKEQKLAEEQQKYRKDKPAQVIDIPKAPVLTPA